MGSASKFTQSAPDTGQGCILALVRVMIVRAFAVRAFAFAASEALAAVLAILFVPVLLVSESAFVASLSFPLVPVRVVSAIPASGRVSRLLL